MNFTKFLKATVSIEHVYRGDHLSTLNVIYDWNRRRNSGRLQAKIGSSYHLAGSTVSKYRKKPTQINLFCKMIVLCSILKQLSTVLLVKPRQITFLCYNCSKLRLLPNF